MKVLSPTKTIERHPTASDSLTNDAVSSAAAGSAVAVPAARRCPSARSTGRHIAVAARAGSTSSGVMRRLPPATTAPTRSGASAKPRLPPVENQPIAVWLPRLAIRASRADSGW
jgi:hypothetical protein